MKRLVLVLLLLLPLPALAQFPTADLSVSISAPSSVLTGQIFTADIIATSKGPDAAPGAIVSIRVDKFLITAHQTPGWNCQPIFGTGMDCTTTSLPANQPQTIHLTLRTQNTTGIGNITAVINASVEDPTINDRRADQRITINAAPAQADLAVSFSQSPSPVRPDENAIYRTTVTNNGPATATNVLLVLRDDPLQSGILVTGSPWTCAGVSPGIVACTLPSLAPGGSATLQYNYTAPEATVFTRRAEVSAADVFDPNMANNVARQDVIVGVAGDYTRVLFPVIINPTPGAFGSIWRSDFYAFADTDEDVAMFPLNLLCPILCPGPPPFGITIPNRVVSFLPFSAPLNANPGRFLYYEKRFAPAVTFHSRIRDESRQTLTWGTELPVVSESRFRTGRIQLIDVPFAQRFRQTLRIYDLDAAGTASFRVRVYGRTTGETEPLLGETTVGTVVPPDNNEAGPFRFPVQPGYAEVSLTAAFPSIANMEHTRVEVEALDATVRFWAFVSVTNNDAQHVTTITPQP